MQKCFGTALNLVYVLVPLSLSRYAKMVDMTDTESCVLAPLNLSRYAKIMLDMKIESYFFASTIDLSRYAKMLHMALNLVCMHHWISCQVMHKMVDMTYKSWVCLHHWICRGMQNFSTWSCMSAPLNYLSRYAKMLDMTDIKSYVFSCTNGICQGCMYNLANVLFDRVYIYGLI